MTKKYVTYGLLLLGVIALLAGILFFIRQPIFPREGKTHTIELTERGFIPQTIAVAKGDTVRFATSRGSDFWPASDLHPTHGVYPEFDPKRPVAPEEEWSFRFNKEGVWNFHDHLSSQFRGKIIVGDSKIAETPACTENENNNQCWEGAIRNALETRGVDGAFSLVATLYATEPAFAQECHSYVHLLGNAAYEKFSRNEDFALSSKTNYCGYGFYHGFMERMLQETGDMKIAQKFCDYAKEKLKEFTTDAGGACFHGIGHGAVDGGDPRAWGDIDAMIMPSMKLCKGVSRTEHELFRCTTGIYNALEVLSADPKYRLEKLRQNPIAFCETQPPEHRQGCHTNITMPIFLSMHYDNMATAAEALERIPEKNNDYTVRYTVISDLYHEYVRLHGNENGYQSRAIAECHGLRRQTRLACIDGLSGGHMKYGEPTAEYVKALAFCRMPELQDDEQNACYRHILTRLGIWYSPEISETICNSVEPQYRTYCSR